MSVSKKRRLTSRNNNSPPIADHNKYKCHISLNDDSIGIPLTISGDGTVKDVLLKFVSFDIWKQKLQHDSIKNFSHFLILKSKAILTKKIIKAHLKSFRVVLLSKKHLQTNLEKSTETNSNGVLILVTLSLIGIELIHFFNRKANSESFDLLSTDFVLQKLVELMQRVNKLWKSSKSFVLTTVFNFIVNPLSRKASFDFFHDMSNSKSNQLVDQRFTSAVIVFFALSLQEITNNDYLFALFLILFQNEYFVSEVNIYCALNPKLNISNGKFDSSIDSSSREKLLFQYFRSGLKLFLHLGNVKANVHNSTSKIAIENKFNCWEEYFAAFVSLKPTEKHAMKLLLNSFTFFKVNEEKTVSNFEFSKVLKLHVLSSALAGYHKPVNTKVTELNTLAEEPFFSRSLTALIPNKKIFSLKAKLLAVDEGLVKFKKQYSLLENQKSKLVTSSKQYILKNANLKQKALEMEDNLKQANELLLLEREANAIRNSQEKTKILMEAKEADLKAANIVVDEHGIQHKSPPKEEGFLQKFFSCFKPKVEKESFDENLLRVKEYQIEIKDLQGQLQRQRELAHTERIARSIAEKSAKNLKSKLNHTQDLLELLKAQKVTARRNSEGKSSDKDATDTTTVVLS